MTIEQFDEPFARKSTALAMALVVVSTFGWNVIVGSAPRVPLAIVGVLYLIASTWVWIWAERRGPRALAIWLVALGALTFPTLWLSDLGELILVMPLIGFPVIYFSMRWGIAMTVVVLAFLVAYHASWGASLVQIYAGSTGFLPGAVFTIVLGLLIVRERDTRKQLRRYASQVEELATTRERNRIAREIHDSVGHYLTVVHVQIEAARATVASDPTASSECLGRAQDFAREGLSELRRSVSILRSSAGEQRPFGVALAALVEDCRNQGLATTLEVHGTPQPLTPAIEFALFRAAQEALTNVTRHANATHARCTLRYGDHDVSLEIADDGVGAVKAEGGFGLVGLRERAELVGGAVTIKTAAGRGFVVEVRIPT